MRAMTQHLQRMKTCENSTIPVKIPLVNLLKTPLTQQFFCTRSKILTARSVLQIFGSKNVERFLSEGCKAVDNKKFAQLSQNFVRGPLFKENSANLLFFLGTFCSTSVCISAICFVSSNIVR